MDPLAHFIPAHFFSTPGLWIGLAIAAAFLFAAGAWKGRIARKSTLKSGLETLLVGAVATALLFLIGRASTFV
jgi:VIT1/CCC1 family predicted Fe2+/Mn2+ transporter